MKNELSFFFTATRINGADADADGLQNDSPDLTQNWISKEFMQLTVDLKLLGNHKRFGKFFLSVTFWDAT